VIAALIFQSWWRPVVVIALLLRPRDLFLRIAGDLDQRARDRWARDAVLGLLVSLNHRDGLLGVRVQIPSTDSSWLERQPLRGLPEAAHQDLDESFGGARVLSSVVRVELGHGERTHAGVGE